jgi:hypothetical protein
MLNLKSMFGKRMLSFVVLWVSIWMIGWSTFAGNFWSEVEGLIEVPMDYAMLDDNCTYSNLEYFNCTSPYASVLNTLKPKIAKVVDKMQTKYPNFKTRKTVITSILRQLQTIYAKGWSNMKIFLVEYIHYMFAYSLIQDDTICDDLDFNDDEVLWDLLECGEIWRGNGNGELVGTKCSDNDGWLNYFEKGVWKGIYGGSSNAEMSVIYGTGDDPTHAIFTDDSYSTSYDYCQNDTQLNEAYCKDGKLEVMWYGCKYGCYNGACRESNNISSWLGNKVAFRQGMNNQHIENGLWKTDPDGHWVGNKWQMWRWAERSRSETKRVEYCKKFYPNTTSTKKIPNEKVHNRVNAAGKIYNFPTDNWKVSTYECVSKSNVIWKCVGEWEEPNVNEMCCAWLTSVKDYLHLDSENICIKKDDGICNLKYEIEENSPNDCRNIVWWTVTCKFTNTDGNTQTCYHKEYGVNYGDPTNGCSGVKSCSLKFGHYKGATTTWESTCGWQQFIKVDWRDHEITFDCWYKPKDKIIVTREDNYQYDWSARGVREWSDPVSLFVGKIKNYGRDNVALDDEMIFNIKRYAWANMNYLRNIRLYVGNNQTFYHNPIVGRISSVYSKNITIDTDGVKIFPGEYKYIYLMADVKEWYVKDWYSQAQLWVDRDKNTKLINTSINREVYEEIYDTYSTRKILKKQATIEHDIVITRQDNYQSTSDQSAILEWKDSREAYRNNPMNLLWSNIFRGNILNQWSTVRIKELSFDLKRTLSYNTDVDLESLDNIFLAYHNRSNNVNGISFAQRIGTKLYFDLDNISIEKNERLHLKVYVSVEDGYIKKWTTSILAIDPSPIDFEIEDDADNSVNIQNITYISNYSARRVKKEQNTIMTGAVIKKVAFRQWLNNQHIENGLWKTDPDGHGIWNKWEMWRWAEWSHTESKRVEYCKKFYPNTVSTKQVPSETINGWVDSRWDVYKIEEWKMYFAWVKTYECVSK